MEKQMRLGKSILATFCGCVKISDNAKQLEEVMREACVISGATVRRVGSVSDEFTPQGVTAAAILQESHAVIDTWPEHATLTFDIFTCGDKADPMKAVDFLKKIFQPERILFIRGDVTETPSVIERTTIVYKAK